MGHKAIIHLELTEVGEQYNVKGNIEFHGNERAKTVILKALVKNLGIPPEVLGRLFLELTLTEDENA